ncbi:hypothetical protein [Pseudomonas ficuserectae]|uniref:hypothetical protein n=1 Tax=Pseudomonas ficuserectae TaxID=53410 RepID=UPI00211C7698|nr:hypothetical protein [Pseudomonas ficuserectae]
MNTDPVIEVTALDVLAYKKDRLSVIGRPHLVLMFDPICGCVLNHTMEVTGSPSDALAQARSLWLPTSGTPTFVIDAGRDFCSSSLIRSSMGTAFKVQHSSRKFHGFVEHAFMQITQRMKWRQVGNGDSTPLTLAEIQQRVRKEVDIHNETIRRDKNNRRSDKVAGIGLPLSMPRAYYSVLQSSLECGFDIEQVNTIWQAASYAYPAGQLRMMFEEIVRKFHSTKMYHDYYRTDVTHLKSLFKPPINILEGEGSVAISAFAHIKDQYDKEAFIWVEDSEWSKPIGSWADLTYALLERLVKDGLATEELRCKLFARDLGL